eukprot:gb/GECG01010619.1/.p1 GENE.gb/GECG01010619.1/~~gb/GECG01010619.1/.p1  ORF type:complete len:320 (+),score=34.90 gb/GECG01010619.1/:1-960(+)
MRETNDGFIEYADPRSGAPASEAASRSFPEAVGGNTLSTEVHEEPGLDPEMPAQNGADEFQPCDGKLDDMFQQTESQQQTFTPISIDRPFCMLTQPGSSNGEAMRDSNDSRHGDIELDDLNTERSRESVLTYSEGFSPGDEGGLDLTELKGISLSDIDYLRLLRHCRLVSQSRNDKDRTMRSASRSSTVVCPSRPIVKVSELPQDLQNSLKDAEKANTSSDCTAGQNGSTVWDAVTQTAQQTAEGVIAPLSILYSGFSPCGSFRSFQGLHMAWYCHKKERVELAQAAPGYNFPVLQTCSDTRMPGRPIKDQCPSTFQIT